jgi:hypothetical protein
MRGLKISAFGEVPMTAGAQQKLLIWLKETANALVSYRATITSTRNTSQSPNKYAILEDTPTPV